MTAQIQPDHLKNRGPGPVYNLHTIVLTKLVLDTKYCLYTFAFSCSSTYGYTQKSEQIEETLLKELLHSFYLEHEYYGVTKFNGTRKYYCGITIQPVHCSTQEHCILPLPSPWQTLPGSCGPACSS